MNNLLLAAQQFLLYFESETSVPVESVVIRTDSEEVRNLIKAVRLAEAQQGSTNR